MREYKVVIAGSRSLGDAWPRPGYDKAVFKRHFKYLREKMDNILKNKPKSRIVIMSGTANGADKLGEQYAGLKHLKVRRYPAKWDEYGKRAGMIRNEQMAKYCDAVVVFWDGESRGSQHMINIALKLKKPLRVIRFDKINMDN